MPVHSSLPDPRLRALPRFIFMSRWLQVPLYIGLIVAQGVYVWQFLHELYNLVIAASGSAEAWATMWQCPAPTPRSPRR